MNGPALVLDSEALSLLAGPPSSSNAQVLAFLAVARRVGGEVVVPAVVCAEVCRDARRTRAVESLLRRYSSDRFGGIQVLDTDFGVAKDVGVLLGAAGLGSEYMADAHVVSAAVRCGGAVVVTSDPDDIRALADHRPAVHVVTRQC